MKHKIFLAGIFGIMLVFGIVLVGCDNGTTKNNNSDNGTTGGGETSDKVYIGVVAFNDKLSTFELSNNLGEAKKFINTKKNDVDRTALCYAVSEAALLFNASGLPTLDNIFVISFTDGVDNGSSSLYSGVAQGQVYDQANSDLLAVSGLKSYAIGFGSSLNQTNMQKLVVNGGEYRTASYAYDLDQVFQDIADNVLASSKNVVLSTNDGSYTESYPKYFKITVTAAPTANSYYTYSDTVTCKLVGYNFTIVTSGSNITFDVPVTGTVAGSKVVIPLNNLKYTSGGSEYYIQDVSVKISFTDTNDYYEDVEDSSASSDISRKIGVVLVLDCSTSLGESFSSVKSSANNFIDTLMENTE
jgi:hypothetical protein